MAMERGISSLCMLLWILFIFATTSNGDEAVPAAATIGSSNIVKKDLNIGALPNHEPAAPLEIHNVDGSGTAQEVVVIEEKSEQEVTKVLASSKSVASIAPVATGDVQVEETNFKQLIHQNDDDLPDSLQTGFYLFIGLSSAALLFIVVKVYRLRLSRAERKYGVQGDRSTQELTPLPISIEDGNSDEDDQTLFEINRQQIRIL